MHTKKLRGSFLFIFFCFFPVVAQAASVSLAEWTFPEDPDDALVDTATLENSTETLSVTDTNSPTFTTSGATTMSARATGWQNGAETKYWHTKINTLGYQNIAVSVKLRSSATGPRDFALQYRTDAESAWITAGGGNVLVADNFTTGVLVALPLPLAAENQEALFLRLVMTSNQSVNGSTVTSAGANRIDDFLITGTLPEEEEPTPGSQCTGTLDSVRINELLPYPNVNDQEYAELFNTGDQCVNLSGWRLEDGGGHKYIFPLGSIIEPESYLVLIQNLFLNNTTPDILTLYSQENEKVSHAGYEKAIKGLGYSFDENIFRFTSQLTPGGINIFDEEDEEELSEPGNGVILNEIFPNPLRDEALNEFIELRNLEAKEKNLKYWSLVDASQKIFTFEEDSLIAPNGLLTVPRSLFGFSLNNTGTESIALLDPQGNTISKIEYTSTQEDFSYSFDTAGWQWTKKVTPGKQNEFGKTLKITLASKTEGYVDIPLSFKLVLKNAKKPYRYSWDFGDGRRSTLAEPKHTYIKTGKYKVSVTVRSDDGVKEKEFTVTIKKYPTHPVFITALSPNPEGSDAGKEWLEIKNFSEKTVDLRGWKIATGTDELTNHPFLVPLSLAPHQTLRLTRHHAAFSLSNSKSVIELRYPNDAAASRVEYTEEKISEESLCAVRNGRCDFTKSRIKKDEERSAKPGVKGESTTYTEETPTQDPPVYPTKREILMRMGNDFNLLMNQIFLDASL